MDWPEYSNLPDLSCSPWILGLNDTENETLINPFNGRFFEASLPIFKGKTCLGCFRDWFLMLDEGTRECFLGNVTSYSKISLPPLLDPIDSLGKFALSSQTPPDCTVMFVSTDKERCVLYCRPGDKEWTKYNVDLDNSQEAFDGYAIFGSKGKIYVGTSWKNRCAVINTTTSDVCIEKMGMSEPNTCPMTGTYLSFWVESNGDIFLVRINLHAHQAIGVTNIDIHQMDTSKYVWRRVQSIGGATFFLGANCVAMSSLVAGTKADCIYLLLWCYDGIRLYSIQLDDRTISFSLLPACTVDPEDWAGTWYNLFWVVPPRFRQEPITFSGVTRSKTSRSVVVMEADKEPIESPWSGLPVELIELLIPKLSFIDYLCIRAVCKDWSLIQKPIQHARTHPMLLSICGTSRGICRFFDPMVKRQYIVKDSMLLNGNWQTLRFSKYGWVLATKGKRCIYATNPFTREVCKLPKMDGRCFDGGISFSSVPKSSDSIVFAIHKYPWQGSIDVMLWRAGDKCWTKEELPCDIPFFMTRSNPVFFDNEFYCLGVHGNLGVFNPNGMTWRVLDKPEPIRAGAPNSGDRLCYLLEFKGDLIAIFRPYDANPIEMFKLDQSQMSWEKVLRLNDAVLFLDNWNATIKSSKEYGCCNRIYLPFVGSNEADDYKVCAFYDLEDGQYKPEFYGLKEPINSLWVEPNFNRYM